MMLCSGVMADLSLDALNRAQRLHHGRQLRKLFVQTVQLPRRQVGAAVACIATTASGKCQLS